LIIIIKPIIRSTDANDFNQRNQNKWEAARLLQFIHSSAVGVADKKKTKEKGTKYLTLVQFVVVTFFVQ
jgi:hypothetical protein